MDFIISLPSLVGIIFSIIQHVTYIKKVAINVLIADVMMCLCPVILSFLCKKGEQDYYLDRCAYCRCQREASFTNKPDQG